MVRFTWVSPVNNHNLLIPRKHKFLASALLLFVVGASFGCGASPSESSVTGRYVVDREATRQAAADFEKQLTDAFPVERASPFGPAGITPFLEADIIIKEDGTFRNSNGEYGGPWSLEGSMLSLTDTVSADMVTNFVRQREAMEEIAQLVASGEIETMAQRAFGAAEEITPERRETILQEYSGFDCEVHSERLSCTLRMAKNIAETARGVAEMAKKMERRGEDPEQMFGPGASEVDMEAVSKAVSQPILVLVKE